MSGNNNVKYNIAKKHYIELAILAFFYSIGLILIIFGFMFGKDDKVSPTKVEILILIISFIVIYIVSLILSYISMKKHVFLIMVIV